MATEKCPYCYRPLNTHTHDPILLPNGSKYKWSDDTHLIEESDLTKRIYKGTYQINEDDVIELQDELKTLEEENLPEIDRTIFSPLNPSGKFQITGKHIKEMRDSVEKLLDIMGLTKTDYFNYDEDGNHIINPIGDKIEWTDPITNVTDLQKFQVKYIHIEDLRHFIESLMERFNKSDEGSIVINSGDYGYFYGDIGQKPTVLITDRPWRAYLSPSTNMSTNLPEGTLYQEPVTGGWYFEAPWTPNIYETIGTPTVSIVKSGENKYLTGAVTGTGFAHVTNHWPAPNGWYNGWGYPLTYEWRGWAFAGTAHLYLSFYGEFKNKMPEIKANNIFTYDLDASGVKSTITSNGITYERIPSALLRITLTDNMGHFETRYDSYSDITAPIIGTHTVDLWNSYVKDHPTFKYIYSVSLELEIPFMQGSAPLIHPETEQNSASYAVGSLLVSRFDNIGLINI